jgi:hypothetical protein
MHTPLNIARKLYKPSLIVLDGQGLNIILGMGWMRAHKALLDTATRVVHLNSPIHGIHVLQLSSIFVATPSVHHTVVQNLEDIPMACEFPDVFPEDLPGMPLDRDVEFIIELQSSIAPISRRPYKITPKELAELKVQLNELLDKRVYPPEFFTLGLSGIVCEEERPILEAMYGLLAFDCCHHQEQIPITQYRHSFRSTC